MSKIIDSLVVAESIKNLRLDRGLTQDELADRVFYSVRQIRRLETNGTDSIKTLNVFAEFFGVSAIDILQGCFLLIFFKRKALFRVLIFIFI